MAPSGTTATSTAEADGAAAASSTKGPATTVKGDIIDVTIHPLVLLSAADHYHRVARGTRKRVVGILLGQISRGRVDATNSFAVPFEEDSRNPAVFYLDHNYLENMLAMFRKVNAKERVVGFYSTGPQIRPNDLRIHDIVERYSHTGSSVFCIIDIRPDRPDLPVTAYKVVEEVSAGTKKSSQRKNPSSGGGAGAAGAAQDLQPQSQVQRSFAHVPSQMGAQEAEEVGVEHLLRDINDPTISTVASLIRGKLAALATLTEKLVECKDYLEAVAAGDLKRVNPDIVANLQTILNLLPNLNHSELVRAMLVKCNDMHMAIYLASLIRSVIALHDLVNNKIRYGEDGTLAGENNKEQAAKAAEKEEEKKEDPADKKTPAAAEKSDDKK